MNGESSICFTVRYTADGGATTTRLAQSTDGCV
jgi:hypothetical protein